MMHRVGLIVLAILLSGCTSTGTLGIVTKSSANPAKLLETAQGFEELGLTEGEACRHFVLAIIPFGNSNFEEAVNKASRKLVEMRSLMLVQRVAFTVLSPSIMCIPIPAQRLEESLSNSIRSSSGPLSSPT